MYTPPNAGSPVTVASPEPATGATPIAPQRPANLFGQIPQAIRSMRPKQWIKNGLIVVAAIFAHRATDLATVERVALAFLAFSLIASAVYIVNDIADRRKDRLHPKKRLRPIASGRLSIPVAILFALLSLLGGAALAGTVALQQYDALARGVADPFASWGGSPLLFIGTLLAYLVINIGYSSWIKHQVLWDVFIIAAGFVLRALAGAFVAMVTISPWFYLCALFLSLFLALGKRRAEVVTVAGHGATGETRASLRHYTAQLLDQLMTIVAVCSLMTYSLYTFQTPESGNKLMITIPFVIFGIFRYLYLVHIKGEGESPDTLLLSDKQLLADVLLCGLVAGAVLYGAPYLLSIH